MKTKILTALCAVTAIFTIIGGAEVNAKTQDSGWNYEKEIEVTKGAYTYYAIPSSDNTEAWIYEIDVNENKEYRTLSFPEKIDGKSVTRLGYTEKKDPDRDDSFNKNIFGRYVEVAHDADGNYNIPKGIEKIIIPDSVEVIQPSAFSGADDITTIKIPKKVTAIEDETFYGCDNLKTVHLPADLKKLEVLAFADCPKLENLKISSKNKVYQVKNKCLITKKDKALVYVLSKDDTIKIPSGIKVIKSFAFSNCVSSKVHIPASVKKIEARAFHQSYQHEGKNIKDVTISSKNKFYAKDGQCIYNKKDKTLSVGIVDSKGELCVSNKIRHLTENYSLVNCDTYNESMNKVVLPKKLKSVTVEAFRPLTEAKKVYFTGTNPPKVKNVIDMEAYASLPIFTDVYVPKDAYKTYKKWYKKYKCYDFVDLFKFTL